MNYLRVWDATKQKYQKFPCDHTGRKQDAHDPANWTDYHTALSHATFSDDQTKPYGVAFSLTANDPWFFLDLDNCRDPNTGQWTAQAQAIFQSFPGAWGEVSQSGNGLHVMGLCDPSQLSDRRNKWDGWLEFYYQDRFIAFGQNGWERIAGVEANHDWTQQLLRLVPQREFLGDLPEGVDERYTGPEDDDKLIEMMLRSKNMSSAFGAGVTAKDLFEANHEALTMRWPNGDGSFDHSSADMALMMQLAFWTGRDMPRMDRLFRRSALMRPKYEREDYRLNTIQNAARLCKTVYNRPKPAEAPPAMGREGVIGMGNGQTGHNEFFLTIPEMIKHFEGCVYVQDAHRVFLPDGRLVKSEQFKAIYGGHVFTMRADQTKPTTNAFEAFTENTVYRFPQARDVSFHPDKPHGQILEDGSINVYVDPQIETEPGDITPFFNHLMTILPNEYDRYVFLNYLKGCVQLIGEKFQWCPVLQGMEGNGKTFFSRCVEYAIGPTYCHWPDAQEITEKYNGYIEGKCFIGVEEVHHRGRFEALDKLKTMITNDRLEIRSMGRDKRMVRNVANYIMTTNHKDAVMKSKTDRRYAVMYTAQQEDGDIERDGMGGDYFYELYEWAKNGGYAKVAHFLKTDPIDKAFRRKLFGRAPRTSSTDAAVAISYGPIEQAVLEAARSNIEGFRGGWISMYALDRFLRDRHSRMSIMKQNMILSSIGYKEVGRSPRALIHQDNQTPMIWARKDMEISDQWFDDFLRAQTWLR
jgi:hypothetical protein